MTTLQFKDKFNALAKSVGVTQNEQSIAEFFWYAGLRHAFQRGTSQAALLKGTDLKYNVENQEFTTKEPPVVKSYKGYESELSPYEAKILTLILQDILNDASSEKKQMQVFADSLWKYCDKNQPETEDDFKLMNKVKSHVAKLKQQLKVISDAQRKLKHMAKGL